MRVRKGMEAQGWWQVKGEIAGEGDTCQKKNGLHDPFSTSPRQPTPTVTRSFHCFNGLICGLPQSPPHAALTRVPLKNRAVSLLCQRFGTLPLKVFSEFLLLETGKGGSLLNSFPFPSPFFKGCGVKIRNTQRKGSGKNWKAWGCSMWEARRAAWTYLSCFLSFSCCQVFSQEPDQTSSRERKQGKEKKGRQPTG